MNFAAIIDNSEIIWGQAVRDELEEEKKNKSTQLRSFIVKGGTYANRQRNGLFVEHGSNDPKN
jgi:hypothetical protein